MLKLKRQYFGNLMQRADSLEKTLMLVRIEGRRRRGQQRMRWFDGITNSVDMSVTNSGRWWRIRKPSVVHSMVLQRVGHDWVTEKLISISSLLLSFSLGTNISLAISVNKGCWSQKAIIHWSCPQNSMPQGEFKKKKTGWCPEVVKMHIIWIWTICILMCILNGLLSPDSCLFP